MHRLILDKSPNKVPNKGLNQLPNKLFYQSNKYASGKWQEKACAQLRVFPKEIYPVEDMMAIFKAILNLDYPIK